MGKTLSFKAENTKVITVLTTNNKFRIPRYQRPYAWGEDEISEFWNDLISNKDPYFIGSLIFNHEPHSEKGYF